jgi:hypothetical protein
MTLLGNAKNRAWESGERVEIHARFGNFPTESFIVATTDLSAGRVLPINRRWPR